MAAPTAIPIFAPVDSPLDSAGVVLGLPEVVGRIEEVGDVVVAPDITEKEVASKVVVLPLTTVVIAMGTSTSVPVIVPVVIVIVDSLGSFSAQKV